MRVFLVYSFDSGSLSFFFLLVLSVLSSILGMLIMVSLVKFFGSDKCLFYRFKLCKLLIFKISKFSVRC